MDSNMNSRPLIVGLGGTAREGSTAERALRAALARAEYLGCDTALFAGGTLPAEIYDPGSPGRSSQARSMVDALRQADGVIIATPAYHASVSGLVKNAIDFIEDLRSDQRVYLQDRAVGTIVCADGPQAMGATIAALRAIVHSLRGWPTPYSAAINSRERPFGQDGQPADPAAMQACEMVADEVVRFVRRGASA